MPESMILVEDEALIRMMLADMIESLGIAWLRRRATSKSGRLWHRRLFLRLAVLDINIAGYSNPPVAEIIDGRGLPFFFVTGYGQQADQKRSEHARASEADPDIETRRGNKLDPVDLNRIGRLATMNPEMGSGGAFRPPLLWSVDFFYDGALTRLDDIGSVVALDVAVFAQRWRRPIDLVGKDLISTDPAGDLRPGPAGEVALPVVPRSSVREETRMLRITSRSLSEKLLLRDGAAAAVGCEAGACAADRPARAERRRS